MSKLILTNKSYKASITLIVILLSFTLLAQKKHVMHENQQWIEYSNLSLLSNKFRLQTNAGLRWNDSFRQKSLKFVRTSLGYQMHPDILISGGLTLVRSYSENQLNKTEIRPYEEVLMNRYYNKLRIQHRFRAEQRFLKYTDTNLHGFHHRLRYRFMLRWPVYANSSDINSKNLTINIGDEVYLNAGKEITDNIFDQNRILIGPSFQFNQKFAITLLYIQKFSKLDLPSDFEQDDIVNLTVRHTFNFTKKKYHSKIDS
ncbi:DUF2490 domain-containing protein [Reichenbachiella sp. MALMAid0571]|uniref:DUF2490 domain-containing protein n=1 Tax=Reichenbachiella sp. MALMAid0571 TaxID=3143939 RepID=UPI0032DF3152